MALGRVTLSEASWNGTPNEFVSESQIGLVEENLRVLDSMGVIAPVRKHSPRKQATRRIVDANRSDFPPGAGIAGGGIIMQSTCGSNPKGPMP